MPPKQTNVEPSDESWLTFRKRHDDQLKNFQQHVTNAYAKFQNNMNREKAILLTKQEKEEEEFWNRTKAAATKSGNKTVVSKGILQGQANRRVPVPLSKDTPSIKQSSAVSSKARIEQTSKPTANTIATTPEVHNKKDAVEIINLCSDDDEDDDEPVLLQVMPVLRVVSAGNPEYDVPSATLELFSETTNPGTLEPSQSTCERSTFTEQIPPSFESSPTLLTNAIDSSVGCISTLIASHHESTGTLPTQKSSRFKGDSLSDWTSVNTFPIPATQKQDSRLENIWAFGSPVFKSLDTTTAYASGFAPSKTSVHRQPASDSSQSGLGYRLGQSSMTQEPVFPQLPLDHAGISRVLFATPQDGHKNKPASQSLQPHVEDLLMREAPQTPPRPQRYTPDMLPSPVPSPHTPAAQSPNSTSSTTPSFRRPQLPASATKDSTTAARNVRANSQASAPTCRASSTTQSQRNTLITSRTPVSSRSSVARGKRKVVDLSSDDESDYAPISEDGELKSPIITEEVRKGMKGDAKKPRLVANKTKLPPPLPPAIAPKNVSSKGKNVFGFQPTPKSKSKVNNQAASSLQNPPQHAPTMKSQSSPPTTPTSASKKSMRPTASTRVALATRPSRKAKLDASAKISQLSETELQTRNNTVIDDGNEYEAPETGVVAQVRGNLRSMSITPAPSTARDYSNSAKDIGMLANISDAESTIMVQSAKHGAGWNLWTHSRINGDRYVVKSRSNHPVVHDDEDDDSEDTDITKYSIVNGIILYEADLENARLTKVQDRQSLMRSSAMDGGSRVRAMSALETSKHKASGRSNIGVVRRCTRKCD